MRKRLFTLLVTLATLIFMGFIASGSTAHGCAGEDEPGWEAERLYYRDGKATLAIGYTSQGTIQADVLFPETDEAYIRSMKMRYPTLNRIYVRIRGQLLGTHNDVVELYHVDRLVMQGDTLLCEDRVFMPKDEEYGFPLARIEYGRTGTLIRLRLEKMPKVDRDMRRILRHMTDGKYKDEEFPDFTFTEQAILDYIFSEEGQALG